MAATITTDDETEVFDALFAAGQKFIEGLESGQYTTITEVRCAEGGCPNPGTVDVTIGSPTQPESQQELTICNEHAIQTLEILGRM